MLELDKTIMQNQDGDFFIVYSNHFDEGIEFVRQNKVPQIHLRKALGGEHQNLEIDFKKLELLSEHLRIIYIQYTIGRVVNPESIYALKNLESIHAEKQKFALDISKFENLKHFGGYYWSKLEGIDKADTLTSAVFINLPYANLEKLSGLRNMENLHIYRSKIESLNGIQNLPIRLLRLARNRLLEDIEAVKSLILLERLSVEKCPKIIGHKILDELKSKDKLR